MRELWVISPLKEKIFLGFHSLECYGGGSTHLARYQDSRTGRYDAVHFYGPLGVRNYTDSVKSIFLMTLTNHQSGKTEDSAQWQQAGKRTDRQTGHTAQNRHGQHQNKGAQHFSSVPTQNRFGVFSQGN